MSDRARLRDLLVERSLETGEFTLSSGARSSYYVDARRTTMTARGQLLVGRVCLDLVEASDLGPTHVGGLTLGADPVTYAIAHESAHRGRPLDGFTVRKAAKSHGAGRRIEGGLPDDARALVVEDTITTGGGRGPARPGGLPGRRAPGRRGCGSPPGRRGLRSEPEPGAAVSPGAGGA